MTYSAAAGSHDFIFCNASPVPTHFAVGYPHSSNNHVSEGWWKLKPGECSHTVYSPKKEIYYNAHSYTDLAKWLAESKRGLDWSGYQRLCTSSNAFKYRYEPECPEKRGFKRIVKTSPVQRYVILRAPNNPHLNVSDAPVAAHYLQAMATFENSLKRTPGKEGKFSLGVYFAGSTNHISSVVPGMPGMSAGIEPGDRITQLYGYRVNSKHDIYTVLNKVPFDRQSPISITIRRDSHEMDGLIDLNYFPFNDPAYNPNHALGVGLMNLTNGALLGVASEGMCAVGSALSEVFKLLADSTNKNLKTAIKDIRQCSRKLDRNLSHMNAMHAKASRNGELASLFVGTGLLAKLAKGRVAINYSTIPTRTFAPRNTKRSFK